jgi:hypothetical protein
MIVDLVNVVYPEKVKLTILHGGRYNAEKVTVLISQ